MKKTITFLSTRAAMMLLLAVLTTVTAWADDVNIVADGSTVSDATTWTDCTVNITGNGTVTFSKRITISGDVTLNISAGATLNATIGITVSEGNSLTIAGDGSLTAGAYGGDYHSAAIGGTGNQNSGTINITGGTISATGWGGGAGIGGGYGGSATINISGGNVTATGSTWSAGIGGGYKGSAGTITIIGGVVNANGHYKGAGIGGGGDSDNPGGGGTITISGGQVNATGGKDGSNPCGYGIGPGKDGTLGTISLSWTESTDFISASSYKGNISFESGKRFYYDETTDYVTADELAERLNQKIIPAVANNKSLANADIRMPSYYVTTNGTAVDVNYDVYDYNGNELTKGTHYTAVIKNSSDNEVTTFDQLGDYTLTITGTGTTYTGSKSFTFSLVEWDPNLSEDGSDHSINFPADGTKKTVYLGKDQTIKVYDSAGKDGNLVISDGRLMLYAPEGYALEVTGRTDAQYYTSGLYYAWLKAYDGNEETEGTLITKIEQNSEAISFASGGNGMLMRFNAQQVGSNKYGLDLTVTVVQAESHTITKGTCTNGDITIDKTSANTNETVTLTVNPASGYLLKRITITDTDNSTTLSTIGEDQWYSGSNTLTFKMPNKNITLTPEFTNDLTADGLPTLNMPLSGEETFIIPDGVKSFNISGSPLGLGITATYASTSTTAIIQASNGYRLQATGNVEFYNTGYDYGKLNIYDGANTSATPLTNIKGMNQDVVSIGTQTSSSNYMTIYLYEDGVYDVKFTGKINMVYSIIYDLVGGSVATENPVSYTCETVEFTLNTPTRTGYTFAGWTGTGLTEATETVTIAAGSSGNREYTATWTPIAYSITYNSVDGATFDTENPTTYTIQSDAITLNNPTKVGYTFAGWTGTGLTEATTTVTIAHGSTGDRSYTATWTENIAYIKNGQTAYCTNYTVLDNTMTTISAGWYVVKNNVEFNGNLSTNADGEVHIILCDGAKLTANKIDPNGNSDRLRIYGQSQGTGTANISGGILASSSLQIYGGTINATGNIACVQMGVGIYGGNVTAAGINGDGGALYLKGGTITAGSLNATNNNGTITLGGATVKANSYSAHDGVTILTGITYYDGTGASYTEGNLTSGQISDIAGKTLTPSNTFSVTANEDPAHAGEYWSTFYHPVAGYTVPSGTTAYIGTLNGSTVTLTEVTGGFIPADNAVILKGASASFNLTRAATGDAFDFTGNDLKGGSTVAAGKVPYTLAAKNGTVGFYKFTGAALNPNKAHLEIDPNSSAPGYFGFDEGTTGITNTDFTDSTDKVGAWYTLDGRKLQGMPTQKGLYIVNGKKIVIK